MSGGDAACPKLLCDYLFTPANFAEWHYSNTVASLSDYHTQVFIKLYSLRTMNEETVHHSTTQKLYFARIVSQRHSETDINCLIPRLLCILTLGAVEPFRSFRLNFQP